MFDEDEWVAYDPDEDPIMAADAEFEWRQRRREEAERRHRELDQELREEIARRQAERRAQGIVDDPDLLRLESLTRIAPPDSPIYRSGLMMVGVPYVRRLKKPVTEGQPPAAPESPAEEG